MSRADECRCRFMGAGGGRVAHADIVALLSRIAGAGLEFVKTENLSNFDGERGYSLGQGE
jgi:isocitrate dehydrogenase